jgi:hypothetical protein
MIQEFLTMARLLSGVCVAEWDERLVGWVDSAMIWF